MDKETLLKRQRELETQFNDTAQRINELQVLLQQLRGGYAEVEKMLKDLEKPVEPEKTDENPTPNKD